MRGPEARQFLERVFNGVCASGATSETIDQYFTDDFVHISDETVVDRARFEEHLAALREDFSDMTFEFTTVIAEGDRLADVHLFRAKGKNGPVTMKFIGVYTLREGKISRFEELSRLIEGAEEDRHLGTRIR